MKPVKELLLIAAGSDITANWRPLSSVRPSGILAIYSHVEGAVAAEFST